MVIGYQDREYRIILFSFFIALLLQTIPCPNNISAFYPNWILLVLFFWILTVPNQINFGASFIVGIILDLINGSTLGIHSLAISIVTYLFLLKYQFFYNQMLWQQMLLIMLMSIFFDLVIFWENVLIINASFQMGSLWKSIVNSIIWPWLYLLMHNIRQHFSM